MELALSRSSYIAVRDEPSRSALTRFVNQDQIAVVPDTGFGIARLLGKRPSLEFNRLRDALELTQPYIIIQPTPRFWGPFYQFLKRHADKFRDFRFLALPISPVLGDDAAIPDADLPGLVRMSFWPHPLLIGDLIQQAVAVVGHSYHLAITALTAGVPVFTPSDFGVGKYTALAGFDGIHPLSTEQQPDLDWFMSRLGRTTPSPQVGIALEKLAVHWDRVAAALRGGSTGSKVAVRRFWQELPGLLEAGAMALQTREQATAPIERSSQERIGELSRLLALAREEIVTRDRHVAELLESTSWKITAPLRFAGRRLRR
jgi:lipopolysaccharide transport system ATP-binding protein